MIEIRIQIPFSKRSIDISIASGEGQGWRSFFGGPTSNAGVSVSEQNALRISAVLACVKVLSETLASLPLPVYKRLKPKGKQRWPDHQIYSMLHDLANPEMTSFTFRETLMAHLLLWGNAYAEIEYDENWYPKALWPLFPDRTYPERDPTTGQIQYRTVINGQQFILPQERVLHIPGLGFDGLKGYSVISMAREAMGMSMAAEEFGARFFGNGAHLGGVLKTNNTLTDKAYDRLKQEVASKSGLSQAHRLKILEEGLTYERIGIPPNDAQFLETRQFQTQEIARIYRVPLHMIGDLSRATFSNIEQMSIEFIQFTMLPWFKRWEQTLNWKLFTPSERKKFYTEFLIEGILRGDIKSRYEAYAIGRQQGWLCPDDIRELEGMNPLPNGQGEQYLVPVNMIPADQVKDFWEARSQIEKQKQAKGGEGGA